MHPRASAFARSGATRRRGAGVKLPLWDDVDPCSEKSRTRYRHWLSRLGFAITISITTAGSLVAAPSRYAFLYGLELAFLTPEIPKLADT
jgi:hypothetical protein